MPPGSKTQIQKSGAIFARAFGAFSLQLGQAGDLSDCRPASATMGDSGRPIHAMSLRLASRSCESLVSTHGTRVVTSHESKTT
jgi:hypothetical protein